MSLVPEHLKYTQSHEWVRLEDDGVTAVVGITDHAQEQLGDLVYVELPEVGRNLDAGEECAVLESVKAAADVYSPVSGEVTAINERVTETPETVNQSPYEDGWLFKVRLASADLSRLMDAGAYNQALSDAEH